MCWEEAPSPESRSRCNSGEAPCGRLRHWGRAALELHRARRGSARIPLRGNPGNPSTGKAPGKTPRELGSAVLRASLDVPRRASEKVAGAGASGKAREEEKSFAPPQPSFSLWQVGGQEWEITGDRRDPVASNSLGKLKGKGKTPALANCPKKKREGIEGRTKIKHRLTPSLRSYFRAGPEDIVLVPGQGKMDTFVIKDVGSATVADKEAGEGFSPLFANSPLYENTQAGMGADMICQDRASEADAFIRNHSVLGDKEDGLIKADWVKRQTPSWKGVFPNLKTNEPVHPISDPKYETISNHINTRDDK
ncbi:hypothetical protein NDU88_001523 [Pleurodeles waltl]|uniref:Uncharacterized protein n=1 Tax=Pleurodeles waltl TaxID=8319 RepID=A0AAV7L9R2_PLEWA|nr:hypothetical protein NDU88_001523 [Pleurodeles waltl]